MLTTRQPGLAFSALILACAAVGQLAFDTAVVRWDRKALTDACLFVWKLSPAIAEKVNENNSIAV